MKATIVLGLVLLTLSPVAALPTADFDIQTPLQVKLPVFSYGLATFSATGNVAVSGSLIGSTLDLGAEEIQHDRITRIVPILDNGYVASSDPLTPDFTETVGIYRSASGVLEATSANAVITASAGLSNWTSQSINLPRLAYVGEPVAEDYAPVPGTFDLGPDAPGDTLIESRGVEKIWFTGNWQMTLFGWGGEVQHADGVAEVPPGASEVHDLPGLGRILIVTYHRLSATHGHAEAQVGDAQVGGYAATVPSWDVDGTLVAARAAAGSPEAHLEELPDGTWAITGPLKLEGLRTHDPSSNSMTAQLAAARARIMVDGEPVVDPQMMLIPTATTLTLAAALALIYKVAPYLSPLLTRLPPGKALENDNRKKLYTYICKKPGATFREVLRGTKIPAGTARHHLNVLARSDMIVERGHRSTLRYFENHGKFDGTWQDVVLLREPELKRVYAWVKEHPHAIQKELLEVAEGEWGWSRSTAQHRLARLVDGGLVAFHQAGRRKAYFIVDPAQRQERKPGLGWMAASQ